MRDRHAAAAARELWLTIWWREDVLSFRRLDDGASFVLGEDGADFPFPERVLGERRTVLLSCRDGRTALHLLDACDDDSELYFGDEVRSARALRREGRTTLPVEMGFSASLVLGDFSIHLACEPKATHATSRLGVDAKLLAIQSALGLTTLTCLVLASQFERFEWEREAERIELAQRYLLRLADDEAATDGEDEATPPTRSAEGATGARAHGEATRYGIAGPGAGGIGLADVAQFGVVGMLSSGAGAPASQRRVSGGAKTPRPEGNSESYADYGVNPPTDPADDAVSTFAIDVDTGAYAIARRNLLKGDDVPPPLAVRAEEFLNYFDYGYPGPAGDETPLAAHIDAAPSPYDDGHQLVRVAIQGKRISRPARKPVHLVYLVDTSGSMSSDDKLGLAQRSLRMLTESLKPGDTVALCTYAGSVREVLQPTSAAQRGRILDAIEELTSEGSTAMEGGIDLAYRMAGKTLSEDSITRVVVLSDGDANVGATSHEEILKIIQRHRGEGITLSTVGFGTGNYNDVMMEQLANAGDGNYSYVDDDAEARRVFVERVEGLLEVVARDVKVQVEFDPGVVETYRLIGYENRDVADADFRKDAVDGGEVGAGHSVTALYDVVLRDYQFAAQRPWVTVRVRHKPPKGSETAEENVFQLDPSRAAATFEDAPASLRFATAVGGFAEVLRDSPYATKWSLETIAAIAASADDGSADHAELRALIAKARAVTQHPAPQ